MKSSDETNIMDDVERRPEKRRAKAMFRERSLDNLKVRDLRYDGGSVRPLGCRWHDGVRLLVVC